MSKEEKQSGNLYTRDQVFAATFELAHLVSVADCRPVEGESHTCDIVDGIHSDWFDRTFPAALEREKVKVSADRKTPKQIHDEVYNEEDEKRFIAPINVHYVIEETAKRYAAQFQSKWVRISELPKSGTAVVYGYSKPPCFIEWHRAIAEWVYVDEVSPNVIADPALFSYHLPSPPIPNQPTSTN